MQRHPSQDLIQNSQQFGVVEMLWRWLFEPQLGQYYMKNRMTAFLSPLKCIDNRAANIHKYTVNELGSDVHRPKRKDVRGDWRRKRNEGVYDLYSSPNIIRVIKSRTKWAGQVAFMGEIRCSYRVLVGRT